VGLGGSIGIGVGIGVAFMYYAIERMEPCGGTWRCNLGRTGCGLGFRDLSEAAGIDYVGPAAAVRRFRQLAQKERKIANLLPRANANA